jgi:hypothetical protein
LARRLVVGLRRVIKGDRCIYCGEAATCRDHFPPYSVEPVKGWLLPNCTECNLLAGDRHPYSFKKRATYVRDMLAHRYKRLLETPIIDDCELAQFGESLRSTLIEQNAQIRAAKWRIGWRSQFEPFARESPPSSEPPPRALELPDWTTPIVTEKAKRKAANKFKATKRKPWERCKDGSYIRTKI